MTTFIHEQPCIDPRRRGSVYILVLGASLLVAAIGISSLLAARVQRRTVNLTADLMQARELARSGIERVMWGAETDYLGWFWRPMLENGDYENRALGAGTFSVTGVDPVDGNLTNDNADPVVLTSEGVYGDAKYILRVTIDGDGTPQPGTWQRVVE